MIQGHTDFSFYKNAYIDLATSYFGISEPEKADKLKASFQIKIFITNSFFELKYLEKEYTIWDQFEIINELTLCQLLDFFKAEHKLNILTIGCLQFQCIVYRSKRIDTDNFNLKFV